MAKGMRTVKFGISFNPVGIVVLADLAEQVAQRSSQETPEDFGVYPIRRLDGGE